MLGKGHMVGKCRVRINLHVYDLKFTLMAVRFVFGSISCQPGEKGGGTCYNQACLVSFPLDLVLLGSPNGVQSSSSWGLKITLAECFKCWVGDETSLMPKGLEFLHRARKQGSKVIPFSYFWWPWLFEMSLLCNVEVAVGFPVMYYSWTLLCFWWTNILAASLTRCPTAVLNLFSEITDTSLTSCSAPEFLFTLPLSWSKSISVLQDLTIALIGDLPRPCYKMCSQQTS